MRTKQPTPALDAFKIPIESLRLDTDGRTWKHAAAQRKILLMHLISFGDRNGNNIFPGIHILMQRTGWSHGKVCYVLEELKKLKAIQNEGLDGRRGKAVRIIDPKFLSAEESKVQPEHDSKESNVRPKESNLHIKESNVPSKESKPLDSICREERGEREECAPPSSSDGERQAESVTADDVIAEAKTVNPEASFPAKWKREIANTLAQTKPAQEEVLPLVRERIGRMDDFEVKQAGSTLAAELPALIIAGRNHAAEKKSSAEYQRYLEAMAEKLSAEGRAKFEAEQAHCDAVAAEEAAREAELQRNGYAGLFGG
jgi:hypothetical protein